MNKKYIIIGTSAAGVAAMRTLRKHDNDAHIICFSDEVEPPYNKCFLADYLGQEKTVEQTYTLTSAQAEQLNIDLRLGVQVIDIASDNNRVMLHDGSYEIYDELLIATGTSPVWPHIEAIGSFNNVFAFHNLVHAQKLHAYIAQHLPKKVVVIGSGLSGVEAADALLAHNIDVTVVEKGSYILSRHVPDKGSVLLETMMQKQNVHLYKNSIVTQVMGENGQIQQVMLWDGAMLKADMVIVAIGLKQNLMLAQKAGIMIGEHGIQVNEYMQTSNEHIFAAGDVIATYDQIAECTLASCTWPDAMQQGMHAALAMTKNHKKYAGSAIITSSAFFGLKFFSCGQISGDLSGFEIIERSGDDFYHRLLIKDGILKGFCLIGNTQQYPKLRRALLLKQPFPL